MPVISLKLFDTHTHYDDDKYDGDRDAVLSGLAGAGIEYILNASYDLNSSEASRALSARYSNIWFAAGIHPHNAAAAPAVFEESLERFFADPKAVALGETGLDYHYDFSPRKTQKDVFDRQLALACKLGRPVIVHDREAHDDVMDILHAYKDSLNGGVYHCFTGDRRLAGRALQLGFHIAFGGALTFKNSVDIVDAAEYAPLDRILLETDCPYMSPAPFRGRRNDSSRLSIIAERMAQIKGASVNEIASATTMNALQLFSITQ